MSIVSYGVFVFFSMFGLVVVGELNGSVGDDVGGLSDGQTIINRDVADAGAAQGRQVCARAESLADIAGECADICAFAAHYSDFNFGLRVFEQVDAVYDEHLGLKLDIHARARHGIGTLTLYLAGRVGRRNLLYAAFETCERLLDKLASDVVGRINRVYLGLEVKRRGRGSKRYRSLILLDTGLQTVYLLGGATGAYYHHAGCQGVKRAGMSDLELINPQAAYYGPAQALACVKRGPAVGLVDVYYFAVNKIHNQAAALVTNVDKRQIAPTIRQ